MGVITLGALDIGSMLIGLIGAKLLPKVVTATASNHADVLAEKIAALKAAIAANKDNESAEVVATANATIAAAEAILAA